MPHWTPIYLPRPERPPRGPDGLGWNRIGLYNADLSGDECALLPRSYAALWEARNNRTATYGAYGRCTRKGACDGCPGLTAEPRRLRSFTDRVMVRIRPREHIGEPWLMNHPSKGWDSSGYPWTWAELARIPGWQPGPTFRDEHSAGFRLKHAGPGQPWEA